MRNEIYCILVFVLLLGCTTDKSKEGTSISVDLDTSIPVELTSFTDSIRYVQLETTENDVSLISNVLKVILDIDGNIYIHDSASKILVFDSDGKFKYAIHEVGQGPEEYIKINNFALNQEKRQIEILDLTQRKVVCYNMSDGSYANALKLGQFVYGIFPVSNNNFLASLPKDLDESGKFGIYLLDSLYNKREAFIEHSGKYPLFAQDFGVFSELAPNKYGIYSQVENAVYHFDGNSLIKQYNFEFNDRPSIASLHGKEIMDMTSNGKTNVTSVTFYQETDHFIVLWVSDNNKAKMILCDKKENTAQVILSSDNTHIFCSPIKSDTKGVCMSILPYELIAVYKNFYSQKENENSVRMSSSLHDLMLSMGKDENPILQIMYLK